MADPKYPDINGRRYDFTSIECNVMQKRILGLKAIDYEHELEPGEVRGTSAQLLGDTRGTYKVQGSIEFWFHEYHELIARLGDGYLEKRFDIVINFAEPNGPTLTDKLRGCRITKPQKSGQSGDSAALSVKCDLHIFYLIENNIKPLSNMRL